MDNLPSEPYATLVAAATAGAAYGIPMTALRRGKVRAEVLSTALAMGVGVATFRGLRYAMRQYAIASSEKSKSAHHEWNIATLAAVGGVLNACAVAEPLPSALVVCYALTKGAREFLPVVSWMESTAVMCITSAVLIPTAYNEPQYMHPSILSIMESWIVKAGVSLDAWRTPPPGRDLSAGIHPGKSIPSFLFGQALPSTLLQSLRLLAPFYTIIFCASAFRSKNIRETLLHAGEGFLRSILFQSGFVISMWVVTLLGSRYVTKGPIQGWWATLATGLGGLWGLVERNGRRVEIASLFVAHALYVMFRRSGMRPRRGVGALLLAVGVAPVIGRLSTSDRSKQNALVRITLG